MDEEFTGCHSPDCGVRVPKPKGSATPLCFDHAGLLARAVNEAVGPDRDAAIEDFRRRVLGWENPEDEASPEDEA